jgi:hypothetical protein
MATAATALMAISQAASLANLHPYLYVFGFELAQNWNSDTQSFTLQSFD